MALPSFSARSAVVAFLFIFQTVSDVQSQGAYGQYASPGTNNNGGGSQQSLSFACGLNLDGKSQRPALNTTTQSNSGPKRAFGDVNFALPSSDTYRNQFNANDMTADLVQGLNAARTPGGQGAISSADINNTPALYREGVSIALVEVAPCAVVVPHVHPRAVELVYVVDGDSLETGILDGPANSRYIITVLSAGQMTFIPKGLAHYQVNRGCNTVRFTASFGGEKGEDPGIWFLPTSLFDLVPDVVASSFDITENLVTKLRQSQPAPPFFKGQAECLRRCGLPANNNNSPPPQDQPNSYYQ